MQILQEKTDTKRPAIVAAATSLFAAKGVDAASMRDVADAAGVREAAIYRHFRSKEQMARAIFASWYGWYSRNVGEVIDGHDSLRNKVKALVRLEFAAARRHPAEFLYFCENEARFLRSMRREIPRVREKLIELVQNGQRLGEIRAGEPGVLADLLSGALCAVAISAIRRKDLRSLENHELPAESCLQMLRRKN